MILLILSVLLSCYNCGIFHKENVPKLGGWNTLPLDAGKVTYLAKFIEENWNIVSGSLYRYKVKVLNASMQVENRIIYQIDAIIDPTGCLKEEGFETCKIPRLEDMEVEKCHFYIQDSSLDYSPIVLSKTCINI